MTPAFERFTVSLLRPGENCWRVSIATRATLLVDADEYFAALRSALLQARGQILISGWDFDSRIHLRPHPQQACSEEPSAPTELGELLGYLIRTRRGLRVHVVRWNYHWMYRDDRELDTRARLERRGVQFHESVSPVSTGCVHHKVVVIDDALAFCGGIDLTHKRWDTSEHDPNNIDRSDAHGAYMPVHDTQLCVSGPIAKNLSDYLRDSWSAPSDPPDEIVAAGKLWPRHLRIDFDDIRAGISRTRPQTDSRPAAREIERLYVQAIEHTRRSLYMENQYFTSTRVARAIAEQCRRQPELEGLLVGMQRPKTAVELHTMGYGLRRFHDVLVSYGAPERIPLVAALCGSAGINLHSKIAIFDDVRLTVGSANLNHRSMGFDIECNLVLEAETEEHRGRMMYLRDRLLGEHLGLQPQEVAEAVRRHGLARAHSIVQRVRHLKTLRPEQLDPKLGPFLAPLFDRDERFPWPAPAASPARPHRWSATLVALVTLATLTGLAWNKSHDIDLDTYRCTQRHDGAVGEQICDALEELVELAR